MGRWLAKSSRFFIGLGLLVLVFTLLFLLLERDYQARYAAEISYYLLVVGVVLALVEYFLSERKAPVKRKTEAKSAER